MDATTPLLVAHGLTKRFGGLVAVGGVEFTVTAGEILGLIGPNGAGKTTLIDLITGVQRADEGTVRYRGDDVTHLSAHGRTERGMARTFQVTRPFVGMSVRENVMIGGLYGRGGRRHSVGDAAARAETAIATVGLAAYIDRPVGDLNTAGSRRLELARSLAAEPDLLFLDELMAGLNSTEVRDVLALIRQINRGGVTILFTEHILAAVMAISHRVMVLSYGKLIADDVPTVVAEDPAVRDAYIGHKRTFVRRTPIERRA